MRGPLARFSFAIVLAPGLPSSVQVVGGQRWGRAAGAGRGVSRMAAAGDVQPHAHGEASPPTRFLTEQQRALLLGSMYALGHAAVVAVLGALALAFGAVLPSWVDDVMGPVVGATLLFLPPYSPDFNPIEKAFARLKAMLRKAAERTVSGLWDLIGKLVDIFQPTECANYFSSCGYDPD